MKFLFSAFFAALLCLTGCGQTGDLVLPPEYTDENAEKSPNKKPAQ